MYRKVFETRLPGCPGKKNMTKPIATLPDFLGDEWDPFVAEMAQKIMEVTADRETERFQMELTSLTLKKPVYLVYKQTNTGVQAVFWVNVNDRPLIPVDSIAGLIRQKWIEGPTKAGYVSFMKVHEKTDIPTRIPRSLVSVLRMLKVIPLPKK